MERVDSTGAGALENSDGPRVIAIVDDDPSIRRALSRVLRSYGLEVQCFASAEEFLERADPRRLGCLLLDVQLTGIDGLELFDRLESDGFIAPTIIITANDLDRVYARTRGAAAAVLSKPIESAPLLAAVGDAIGSDLAWGD